MALIELFNEVSIVYQKAIKELPDDVYEIRDYLIKQDLHNGICWFVENTYGKESKQSVLCNIHFARALDRCYLCKTPELLYWNENEVLRVLQFRLDYMTAYIKQYG